MNTGTYTSRPLAGEADLAPLAELIECCEALDQLGQGATPDDLRMFLRSPNADPARNLCLWHNADGRLLGCGQLMLIDFEALCEGRLRLYIHPDARDTSLGDAIVAWGEQRMHALGAERGVAVRIRSLGRDDRPFRLNLVRRHGFVPERYFLGMARSLGDMLPEPEFPAGFALRQFAGAPEAAAWVELFNDAFRDHWNHFDFSVADVEHWLTDPNYRPELSLLAVAPDGELAGLCWCAINHSENQRLGELAGWIEELGVRRQYRGRGLGRALLLAGMRQLHSAGMAIAKLTVDADSPTGATRLYESVGFRTDYATVSSVKLLTARE